MKHAVLISGEYRTFDQASKSMGFLHNDNVDVYFSLWDNDGLAADQSWCSNEVTQSRISEALAGKLISGLLIESPITLPEKYNNTLIYRWQQGIKLIKSTNIAYNTISIIRPDLWFFKEQPGQFNNLDSLVNITDDYIYPIWATPARSETFEDVMFVLSPGTAERLLCSDTFRNSWNDSDNNDWHKWVYSYLGFQNITIGALLHGISATIRRPTCKKHDISDSVIKYNQTNWNFSVIEKQINMYGDEVVTELWHPTVINDLAVFNSTNNIASSVDLNNYVCMHPFKYMDVQSDRIWTCCPSWVSSDITERNAGTLDVNASWTSKKAKSMRDSVTDGSYSMCNKSLCPSLSELINTGKIPYNFISKDQYLNGPDLSADGPAEVLFGFDRSCNLRCPSCRSGLVANDGIDTAQHIVKLDILNQVESLSSGIRKLLITGSGDPIYSKIYRDYLINFDHSKYPNLQEIQLITNGILLNEQMWDKLNCTKYIKHIEISMDAGNKHTYETITRLNGDWDKLITNIRFLSTQASISTITCSMVVSKYTFREMVEFYNVIHDIFANAPVKVNINYRQIAHWGTSAYSVADIKELSIFDNTHPLFTEFCTELQKIHNLPFVNHNFGHLL